MSGGGMGGGYGGFRGGYGRPQAFGSGMMPTPRQPWGGAAAPSPFLSEDFATGGAPTGGRTPIDTFQTGGASPIPMRPQFQNMTPNESSQTGGASPYSGMGGAFDQYTGLAGRSPSGASQGGSLPNPQQMMLANSDMVAGFRPLGGNGSVSTANPNDLMGQFSGMQAGGNQNMGSPYAGMGGAFDRYAGFAGRAPSGVSQGGSLPLQKPNPYQGGGFVPPWFQPYNGAR